MTKIEEVARAIREKWESIGDVPFPLYDSEANALAIAAISAMRNVDGLMLEASMAVTEAEFGTASSFVSAAIHHAVIDAALDDHKPKIFGWNCDGVVTDPSKLEFLGDPEFEARK